MLAVEAPGNSRIIVVYGPVNEAVWPPGAGMAMNRSKVLSADSVLEPRMASGLKRAFTLEPARIGLSMVTKPPASTEYAPEPDCDAAAPLPTTCWPMKLYRPAVLSKVIVPMRLRESPKFLTLEPSVVRARWRKKYLPVRD